LIVYEEEESNWKNAAGKREDGREVRTSDSPDKKG